MTILEYMQRACVPSAADLVTTAFDLIFVWSGALNVRRLILDKQVKGFDYRTMCLFVSWNIWSIVVVYPAADLYLAGIVNTVYLMTQLTWLWLFVKLRVQSKI